MQVNIVITLKVEGFHSWPAARNIYPEVDFLSDRHRHIFHIRCVKTVMHDDRDVEIIMFKREVIDYLYLNYGKNNLHKWCEFGAMSCEMIAKELVMKFKLELCEVLEDGENGAVVLNNYC